MFIAWNHFKNKMKKKKTKVQKVHKQNKQRINMPKVSLMKKLPHAFSIYKLQ